MGWGRENKGRRGEEGRWDQRRGGEEEREEK